MDMAEYGSRRSEQPQNVNFELILRTLKSDARSSWLNCALRDDEAVYWVSIGHYEAVAVGN